MVVARVQPRALLVAWVLLVLGGAAGCGYHEGLRMIAPAEPRAAAIAERLVEALDREGGESRR